MAPVCCSFNNKKKKHFRKRKLDQKHVPYGQVVEEETPACVGFPRRLGPTSSTGADK